MPRMAPKSPKKILSKSNVQQIYICCKIPCPCSAA